MEYVYVMSKEMYKELKVDVGSKKKIIDYINNMFGICGTCTGIDVR